ncbi:TPM domain-containing protein [Sphingobacterium sp. SYP-B4668]|uniref:TPM domain-containing protein n=1 Tax=Sphingobacterium sp. SYP-B4668 TaxID=2996035 RepID=UPI0022DD17AC|nr:TPM domain-containing protein [Sphingobacterium sp. SYP-B4668]
MQILSAEEQEQVAHAISVAENMTSGEIRIVIENTCPAQDPLDRAVSYFKKLEMHATAQRNGVLVYLAAHDHLFAIIGDAGINERVGPDFWESTKETMASYFRTGELAKGLIAGVHQAGNQLKHFYPNTSDDVNELPNEIHFGNSK